jgi:hypothetical protein
MSRETAGCSELGALFGVDPRCTRRHLYLRLIGAVPDRVTTAPMLVGQTFEPAIASWYVERHPGYQWSAKYARREDPPMVRGRLHGHPDGLITVAGDEQPSINGEIKIPMHSRHEWRNGPPLHYQWQAQGQMALSGFAACIVVECMDIVLRGDEIVHIHCREHLVERDERVHAAIFEECERFFAEHVIPRVPPPATAEDLDDLRAQPPQAGEELALGAADAPDVVAWLGLCEQRKALERQAAEIKRAEKEHEARLLERIGAASVARLPGGASLERKARRRREFTVPASTSYTLSYKEPK